tara:strand:+ start:141 stop:671 length:531 start_codon:yes stop_codon:yes gene_type:complete
MDKIQNTIHQIVEKYQEEIIRQHPSVSISDLKNIWETLGESKKTSEKRKRTAYQNYFVQKREDIATNDPALKFGDISKIISTEWNQFTDDEKKRYETVSKKEDEICKKTSSSINIQNTNTSYIHLFENNHEENDDHNRIDFEQDEDNGDDLIEEVEEDEEDDNDSVEDHIDFGSTF